MNAGAKSAVLLWLLGAIAACALIVEPTWRQPRVVPPGWTADYDYTSDIWPYLRHQFDSALLEGASAYIYIYSDEDPHCIRIREMVASGQIAAAFDDVRITMLNYDRLKWLRARKIHIAFDPGNWEPVIVKIASNGGLTKAVILPDIYLFHTEMLAGRSRPLLLKPLTPTALAKELKAFFQSSDEI